MVVGEPQILSQVKQAYQVATEGGTAGPLLDAAFQAALKTAQRVAGETAIHQRRVSIPSVAVADFAQQIFERFDDKKTLVIGAGEMAEETLRYLRDQGARDLTVINRRQDRAAEPARRSAARPGLGGADPGDRRLRPGDQHHGGRGAIVTPERFAAVETCDGGGAASGRPLFILDLAVPRDFDPAIAAARGLSLFDRRPRPPASGTAPCDKEIPAATRIVRRKRNDSRPNCTTVRRASSANSRPAGRSPRRKNSAGCSTSCRTLTNTPGWRFARLSTAPQQAPPPALRVAPRRLAPRPLRHPGRRPSGSSGSRTEGRRLHELMEMVRKEAKSGGVIRERNSP